MRIVKVRDVKTPQRGTPQSAGIDFFVPNDYEKIVLGPGDACNIPSGIHAKIPKGYALIAMEKSGVFLNKRLEVGAKVVDEDYQGEIHLSLVNGSSLESSVINPGEKIVQMLLVPVSYETTEEVSSLEELYGGETTERGSGGFGSTGTT
jgi:dUTP pyrophosphatase